MLDPVWQSMYMDPLVLGPRYIADHSTAADNMKTDSPMKKKTVASGMLGLEGTVGSKCFRNRAPKGRSKVHLNLTYYTYTSQSVI